MDHTWRAVLYADSFLYVATRTAIGISPYSIEYIVDSINRAIRSGEPH